MQLLYGSGKEDDVAAPTPPQSQPEAVFSTYAAPSLCPRKPATTGVAGRQSRREGSLGASVSPSLTGEDVKTQHSSTRRLWRRLPLPGPKRPPGQPCGQPRVRPASVSRHCPRGSGEPLTAYWNFSLYSLSLARALLSSSAKEGSAVSARPSALRVGSGSGSGSGQAQLCGDPAEGPRLFPRSSFKE